jgi:hypothetical protein
MADNTHPCVADRCGVPLPPHLLMCKTHWHLVPTAIRRRVLDRYRRGQTAATASPEYLEAMRDAIAAVREAEAQHG